MIDFNQLDSYGRIKYIFQSLQALIALIGIIGNILTFVIFSRPRLRKYSYSFFSRAMACSDILILLHSFRHGARNILQADLDIINGFLCAIGEYQPSTASIVSLWLLTLISVDRLTTIIYPHRFKPFKSRWIQLTLVLFVVAYSLLVSINLPLFYRLEGFNSTDSFTNTTQEILVCYISIVDSNRHFLLIVSNIITVNILVNNYLNYRMIRFVYASRKNVSAYGVKSSVKDKRFAITSIGLNFCCLVCKLPLTVLIVFGFLPVDYTFYNMLYEVCVTISIVDNAGAFFLNMITNKSFREEFIDMIKLTETRT